jgi:hypothetical protein
MPEIFRVIQITLDQDQAVSAVTALADADTAEIVRKLASNAAVQRRESGGVDQLANGPGGVMLQMSARAMTDVWRAMDTMPGTDPRYRYPVSMSLARVYFGLISEE